jgi:hypothetical protein
MSRLVVAGVLMVAILGTLMLGAGQPQSTYADGACGSRIQAAVPGPYQPYISKACYDPGVWSGSGVQLTLTTSGTWACRLYYDWCRAFGSWVVTNVNWRGNRPSWSVSREIYYHSLWFMTNPIHIEYRCGDLKWWERWYYGC